tara:strand:- start:11189 stop:11776 length:588 start_codon:yes stop_codon:yes gene_type:complete
MNIGVVLLAAGVGQRFGSDKRQAVLPNSKRMLDTTIANISASGLPLLVCVGVGDERLLASLEERGIDGHLCPGSREGMGATLADGVAAVDGWDGLIVALADMPWIETATYRRVADMLEVDRICVPTCGGRDGHPVGFGRTFFSELCALRGNSGGRHVIQRHAGFVSRLPVTDPAIAWDVDVPGDISRLAIENGRR